MNAFLENYQRFYEMGRPNAEAAVQAFGQRRQREQNRQIGQAVVGKDYAGAQNLAVQNGDLDQLSAIQGMIQSADERQRAELKMRTESLARLRAASRSQPVEARAAWATANAPRLGIDPSQIASAQWDDASIDGDINLARSVDDLIKAQEFQAVGGEGTGYFAFDKSTGNARQIIDPAPKVYATDSALVEYQRGGDPRVLYEGQKTTTLGEGQSLVETRPAGGVALSGGRGGDPDAVWAAAIQQESGGRPGILGPRTPYGTAQGMTQMLPETAQSMAQKLGVAWRPELMTGTTPEAAEYQQRLGRAYFDEGLERYGGDVRKAVAFYHGGPNERLWGPKTRAHVEAVMGRVQPYEVASAGPTPAGPRVLAQGAPKQREQWEQLPDGRQRNTLTGKIEGGSGEQWVQLPDGRQRNTRTGKIEGSVAGAKVIPATAKQRYNDLRGIVRKADQAITLIGQYPDALGLKNYAPDIIMQRLDEKGVPVRAAVGELGATEIHELSGAAVTASEFPRLKPFVPLATDSPSVARTKLRKFREEAAMLLSDMETEYGAGSGYTGFQNAGRPPTPARPQAAPQRRQATPAPQAAPASRPARPAPPRPGEVRDGYRFKGGNPASPSSWVKAR